jgi:HPt (histidine-containing phosphotransfer) domain-containing protein
MAARDSGGAGKLAHGLKGASGAIGARTMAALSDAIEHQAPEGITDRLAATMTSLQEEFGRVQTYFAAVMADKGR